MSDSMREWGANKDSAIEQRQRTVKERDELTRYVLEWCWLNGNSPPEIHDAAACLLGEPSLASGCMHIGFKKWKENKEANK